jgi:hypothetical protein
VSTTRTDQQLTEQIRRGYERFEPSSTTLPVKAPGRSRSPWAAALVLPIAGLLIAVVAIQVARPQSAFASWSAVPVVADPALQAALLESCKDPITPETTDVERAFLEEVNRLPMVLVDQRGTSGVALFAVRRGSGIASKLCLGSHDDAGTLRTAGSGSGLGAQERPSDGPLRLVGQVQIWSYGGETLSAAFGTSDPSVAKVVVSRASGGDVTATVKDGYWVAWWPGEAAAQRVASFAADGSEVKTIAAEAIAP